MNLILWRHAEAEMAGPGMTDENRRLTRRGKAQAQAMAAWLLPRLPAHTRVLVSPTERTRQTARALRVSGAFESRIEPRISPDSGVDDLMAAAGWPGADETVLLVGHQPTLGQLAARLLTGQTQDWSVKKGAICWLQSRERDGRSQTVLRAMLTPALLL